MSDLKTKALFHDPAFYVALAPLIASIDPGVAAWITAHKEAFLPVLAVIVGHYGVRMSSVKAAGKVVAHTIAAPAAGGE